MKDWMIETYVISDSLKQVKCHHGVVVPIQGVGNGLCGARSRAGQDHLAHCTAALGASLASAGSSLQGNEREESSTGGLLYRYGDPPPS